LVHKDDHQLQFILRSQQSQRFAGTEGEAAPYPAAGSGEFELKQH
jgi:hypothetical protein